MAHIVSLSRFKYLEQVLLLAMKCSEHERLQSRDKMPLYLKTITAE